jgi:hypothetical protein
LRLVALAAAWLALVGAAPAFDPVTFFTGRTQGEGRLKIVMQPMKTLKVVSVGRAEADGTLVLQQVVSEQGKPPRTRFWRLKNLGGGRYAGTLTDAAGPVRIDSVGNRVRIRYKGKDRLEIDQWLTPNGPRRVDNRMKVRRFGLVVAHVDEVITKVD